MLYIGDKMVLPCSSTFIAEPTLFALILEDEEEGVIPRASDSYDSLLDMVTTNLTENVVGEMLIV